MKMDTVSPVSLNQRMSTLLEQEVSNSAPASATSHTKEPDLYVIMVCCVTKERARENHPEAASRRRSLRPCSGNRSQWISWGLWWQVFCRNVRSRQQQVQTPVRFDLHEDLVRPREVAFDKVFWNEWYRGRVSRGLGTCPHLRRIRMSPNNLSLFEITYYPQNFTAPHGQGYAPASIIDHRQVGCFRAADHRREERHSED